MTDNLFGSIAKLFKVLSVPHEIFKFDQIILHVQRNQQNLLFCHIIIVSSESSKEDKLVKVGDMCHKMVYIDYNKAKPNKIPVLYAKPL